MARDEGAIEVVVFAQFAMRAGGDKLFFVQQQNAIGVLNRREPMRDDEQGFAARHFRQSVENGFFEQAVERGGRLVQNQNIRVFD